MTHMSHKNDISPHLEDPQIEDSHIQKTHGQKTHNIYFLRKIVSVNLFC